MAQMADRMDLVYRCVGNVPAQTLETCGEFYSTNGRQDGSECVGNFPAQRMKV